MGLKLDVKFNWLVDKTDLSNKVKDSLKNVRQNYANIGRAFNKNYFGLPTTGRINEDIKALSKYGDVFVSTFNKIKRMDKKGELSYLIGTMFEREGRQRKHLTPSQMFRYAITQTENKIRKTQLDTEDFEKYATESPEEKSKADWERYKESEKTENAKQKKFEENMKLFLSGSKERFYDDLRNQQEKQKRFEENMRRFLSGSKERFYDDLRGKNKLQKEEEKFLKYQYESEEEKSKADYEHHKEQEKKLKEDKKKDEKFRKDALNAFFMRWGKLGVFGLVAQQAIKYISKAVGYVYSTSMQGLDWTRTVSGGAAGGNWFGQGLAGYQRAGIGASQYQGFKRGIQSYLGQVKLGMGNAAPLMMLGLSALDNPDVMERQIERSLRRFPRDVSLALAQQMGLDYNMWDAIYRGRIDREKSSYSEDAMRKWGYVADKLNDLLTSLKVFGFEKVANIAYGAFHPMDVYKNASFIDKMLMSNPLTFTTGFAHASQNITINVNTNGSSYQDGQEIGRGCRDAMMQMRD